jgi:beta-glucosidase
MKTSAWRLTILMLILAAGFSVRPKHAQDKYPFQDPSLSVEERVNNIISLMTLEEEIAALGTNPSVPRLGIVSSGHVEGLHGLACLRIVGLHLFTSRR